MITDPFPALPQPRRISLLGLIASPCAPTQSAVVGGPMMVRVHAELVGPSLSAVIDGVSYVACLNVNDLYTARLCCGGCGSSTRVLCVVTQYAIRGPDFCMVIRRDYPVGA